MLCRCIELNSLFFCFFCLSRSASLFVALRCVLLLISGRLIFNFFVSYAGNWAQSVVAAETRVARARLAVKRTRQFGGAIGCSRRASADLRYTSNVFRLLKLRIFF